MGIFDDAIRQHLDLKRRQGADESELKQLEDEAFGLPARPGDPDFPETGESRTTPAEQQQPAGEAPKPVEQSAPTAEDGGEGADLKALVKEEDAEPAPADDAPPHGDALLEDSEAKPEPPPDPGTVEDEGAPGFTTAERQAIADQPTEFFDQAPAELELGELDLDLEDEIDEVGSLEEQPLTDEQLVEEAAPAEKPPAEPQAEPAPPADEPQPPADQPEPPAEPEPAAAASGEEAPAEAESAEGGEEDVLEETPEFLRDNPDDDELWFEQGQPKDFDF